MFNFLKKKAPTWNDLSKDQKQLVASRVSKTIKAMAGARYKIVSGLDQLQREQGLIETLNEDQILNQYRRGRMLDMTRNLVRNSSTFNTVLKQLDFNVIGTQGGKVIINTDDQDLNHELRDKFSVFTRNADFFDGMSFNNLLKLILKQYVIGGDCCILFDDGLIENSGKLLVYETDEIGNTSQEAIERHFGKKAHQSLGKVYNRNGRWIGAVVSRACRGAAEFDPDKCYFLKRDPDASNFDSYWFMPQNIWRSGQGRGTTQAASSIGTIIDLEDLQNFELQASKMNAQSFCQIYNTSSKTQQDLMPSAFDSSTDFSQMTDAEIEAAAKLEQQTQEEVISFDKAASCGILYQQMPEDWKMEILDTKHVNPNTQEFIKWLAGRSSSVFGLSEVFATLMPDGSNFRAQQLLTQPCFEEAKKSLIEPICDWTFFRFINWLDHNGEFDMKRLPPNFMRYVSWSFPQLDELDPVAHENAIALKLKNMTANYHDILGNDWKQKLLQTAEEIKWLKANGLPIPQYQLKSGGEGTGAEVAAEAITEV